MAVPTLETLKVKLFTDGADKAQILDMAKNPGSRASPPILRSSRRQA